MPAARVDINEALVFRMIEAQFPEWAHLSIRGTESAGWDNRTFRLGEDMIVRLPSAEVYAAQVEKEQGWLPRLAPHLPLAIPVPLAMGLPSEILPWHWSVYQWIEGETATIERIGDLSWFATTLAQFLLALEQIDSTGGPPPGSHNFFRGGPLAVYDAETREAISSLRGEIDVEAVTTVWDAALDATWDGTPVWLHGDMKPVGQQGAVGRSHRLRMSRRRRSCLRSDYCLDPVLRRESKGVSAHPSVR